MTEPMKALDILFFCIALGITVFIGVQVYADSAEAATVIIQSRETIWIYSLDTERTVHVKGPLGVTVVKIENEAVHIESSPCRDKLCMQGGWLDSQGDWTACLPNQVFVRISGEEQNEIDEISY